MKLLVLTQHFWPETFPINDIVSALAARGHDVTVATGKPNYPEGRVFDGYSALGTQRERYLNRVDVFRVPLWPRGGARGRELFLNYVSFVFCGLVFFPWLLRGRQFDAILVFGSSPITQAIPAILIKWIKRAPLTIWIQDLWPESLSATGFVKNKFLLRQVGRIVKHIYRHSDLLLVQSRAFIEPVASFSERRKIVYQPNAVMSPEKNSVEEIPVSLSDVLYKKFCVVFAGNLGFAQGLQTIIDAAINLKHHKHIRFILVGSGSRLSWLEEQKKMYGLDNLMLPGRFPSGAMPKIFSQSSALLVSLSDKPAFEKTVPSKTQMYMAAGRPILASLNGEGARIIEEAHCGFVSAAGDVNGLVGNVIRLWQTPVSERNRMGQASRVYFEREFEMETQMTKLLDKIRELKKRI